MQDSPKNPRPFPVKFAIRGSEIVSAKDLQRPKLNDLSVNYKEGFQRECKKMQEKKITLSNDPVSLDVSDFWHMGYIMIRTYMMKVDKGGITMEIRL